MSDMIKLLAGVHHIVYEGWCHTLLYPETGDFDPFAMYSNRIPKTPLDPIEARLIIFDMSAEPKNMHGSREEVFKSLNDTLAAHGCFYEGAVVIRGSGMFHIAAALKTLGEQDLDEWGDWRRVSR